MSKVKTKSVFIYKRSSLLNMTSKYSTKCFLKQMRRTVVSFSQSPVLCINLQCHSITDLDHTLCHMADMSDLCSCKVDTILYNKLTFCCPDHSLVSFLSTHRCIERGLLNNDRSLFSVRQSIHDLILCSQCGNF